MKCSIELEVGALDDIVVEHLERTRVSLQDNLDTYNRGECAVPTFCNDLKEDRKLLKKHIKALHLILKWYS